MARYTGATCRLCRREGQKLFLKGDRCFTDKCAFVRRSYAPGQHGAAKKKMSNYGVQLREKQKARRIYGVLEKQFRAYYEKAEHMKGISGENLLKLLEMRLDNVVYRLGYGASRNEARQLVTHGHFLVNGVKTDIPSYRVNVGDVIEVRERSLNLAVIKEALENKVATPAFVEVDTNKLTGKLTRLPERSELNSEINESLIVEYYNRLG